MSNFNLEDYVKPEKFKVKLIKKKNSSQDNKISLEKFVTIYENEYPDEFDFYEQIALKLGWKEDMDALWFLSQKGIEKIERL